MNGPIIFAIGGEVRDGVARQGKEEPFWFLFLVVGGVIGAISKGDMAEKLDSIGLGSRDESFVFRGSFEHSLDDQGRVSIPAVFRQVLSGRNVSTLVLTNFVCDGARCLEAFPFDVWCSFEEKLAKRSRFDPQLRKLENFYLARAVECAIDGSGRITIPQNLRSYCGLDRDAVFTAALDVFRIWDKRVWELVFREAETALLENPALFADVDRL